MVRKSKGISSPSKLLTEVELELMSILWRIGEGSVADVIGGLPKDRDLAYTSVSTILRILEQKKAIKSRKEGRGHIYIPTLKKSDYEAKTLIHVMENVFEGTPVALVKQLLSTVSLKESELKEIKDLIAKAWSEK